MNFCFFKKVASFSVVVLVTPPFPKIGMLGAQQALTKGPSTKRGCLTREPSYKHALGESEGRILGNLSPGCSTIYARRHVSTL